MTDIGRGAALRNASIVVLFGLAIAIGFKALDGRLPVLRTSPRPQAHDR